MAGTTVHEIRDPHFRLVEYNSSPLVPYIGTYPQNSSMILGDPGSTAQPLPAYLENDNRLVFWLDRQPAVTGANYQYLIVCFTERGEVDRIIPVNPAQF